MLACRLALDRVFYRDICKGSFGINPEPLSAQPQDETDAKHLLTSQIPVQIL